MCVPNSLLFQRCQVYDWSPFFNKKYMNGPIFLDSYVKRPIFLTSWYMHTFFAQIFFEAAYPLGITWIDYDICVIISKNGYKKKIKGQYLNRSTFWMIKYMNGSVFSKARYMNGVGFEILARTSVPKLPLSYPRPPPPPPPTPSPTRPLRALNSGRHILPVKTMFCFNLPSIPFELTSFSVCQSFERNCEHNIVTLIKY